jgi:hypothetical protein
LPTLAYLLNSELPDHTIDGKNVWPLLSGEPGAGSPHEKFLYYAGNELHAVRSGDWKLHFPHPYLEVNGEPGKDGKPSNFENLTPDAITQSGLKGIASRHGYKVMHIGLELYNLRDDIRESKDIAEQHPEIVSILSALGEEARNDLGDALQNRTGSNIRPAGKTK